MSIGKNHTEDLRRYLNGEMSNAEANLFEKNALNDPFLQDAIDGAQTLDSEQFNSDIDAISQNFPQKLSNSSFPFWKIAAVVSLLITVTVTLWFSQSLTKVNEVAMADPPEKNSEVSQKENEPQPEEAITEKKTTEKADGIFIEEIESTTSSQPKKAITSLDSKENEKPQREMEETGPVVEKTTVAPVEAQTAEVIETDQIDDAPVETDLEVESFQRARMAKTTEQPAEETLAIQPFVAQQEAAQEEIVETQAQSFQGVGVSGYGDYDNEPNGFVDAIPVPDYKFFREYIEENLQYPEEAKAQRVEGTVVLQLTISPIGNITDIEVKKSLGSGCDEEAIRLIQEGPKWEPASLDGVNVQSKIKIRIGFELD